LVSFRLFLTTIPFPLCSHWLTLRDERVVAKGKGELVTYWLEVKSESSGEKSSRHSETGSERFGKELIDKNKTAAVLLSEKTNRLIDWNTDVLYRLLQQIIFRRGGASSKSKQKTDGNSDELLALTCTNPFEEVKEIISLPQMKESNLPYDESMVKISIEVFDQLRNYVSCIANMYNKNEFHNFEHVSILAIICSWIDFVPIFLFQFFFY
jgi:hypothetical protein